MRILISIFLLLLPAGALAQTDASDVFERQLEEHRDTFRWIDVGDMRGVRTSVRTALARTAQCQSDGDCPDFDCTAANRARAQAGELALRLDALTSAFRHMQTLELAHLESLHREANIAEAIAEYQNEVLFWQSAVISVSSATIQVALIAADMEAIADISGALTAVSALDENIRDRIAFIQDIRAIRERATPRFRQQTDPLDAHMSALLDLKSNTENLLNGLNDLGSGELTSARQNAIVILGRTARSMALEELARRQDEVARLNADAFREREEANAFARRLHGLALQRELSGMIADMAFDLHLSIGVCTQPQCEILALDAPDVPRILRPADPEDPIQRPRLDNAALERNVGAIIRLADDLYLDWTQPRCGLPEEEDEEERAELGDAISPASLAPMQSRQSCETIRNVGICGLLTEDRRAECEAEAALPIAACGSFPDISARFQSAAPASPAFQQAIDDLCRASCDMLYGMDAYLDHQRELAIEQIAELEQGWLARGGEALLGDGQTDRRIDQREALRDQIRAVRATANGRGASVFYDPVSNSYVNTSGPDHIYIASPPGDLSPADRQQIASLRAEIEALTAALEESGYTSRTVWGEEATRYWTVFGPHQFLSCGGQAELASRRARCEASCASGGAASYQSCTTDALELDIEPGPNLYPPDDPCSVAVPSFNTRDALANTGTDED